MSLKNRLVINSEHPLWGRERVLPEKGENRKTKKEFGDFIRECVKALTPVSTEKTITIPDLNQYLPDDGDSPEDSFDGTPVDGPKAGAEGFDRTPKIQTIAGRTIARAAPTKPGGNSPGEGDDGAGGDDAGDDGGGPNDTSGGNKGSTGGGTDDVGTPGGDGGRTKVEVRSRAFLRDGERDVYALIVHPPKKRPVGTVYLSVAAVGDDSLATAVRLKTARMGNNRKLEVPKPGKIGPVAFPKSGPLRVEVMLAEPRRLALEVTAYEEGTADEAQ